jgi:hypothetical protein
MSAQIIQFDARSAAGLVPTEDSNASSTSAPDIYPAPWEVLDGLPFVAPPLPRRSNGRLGERNCWLDNPTDRGPEDYARGHRYAKMMLSAMHANSDTCESRHQKFEMCISARAFERVIESMVGDAVTRQKKGGKYSRTLITSAMAGFLSGLTRHIAGLKE